MTRRLLSVLLAAASMAELSPLPSEAAEVSYAAAQRDARSNIVYVRGDSGWEGYWPRGGEYVQYALGGNAELNDGFHVLLRPGLGLMLTFAERKKFAAAPGLPAPDLLEAHKQWELAYWRAQAGEVEARDRGDLAGTRHDVKVTELRLTQNGKPLRAYLIGAAAPDGVFVFAISPVAADDDALVKRIVASIRVVPHPLDPAEVARIKGKAAARP